MWKGRVFEGLLRLAVGSGLPRRIRRLRRGRATILYYHGVTDRPRAETDSPSLHTPVEGFRRQMQFLAAEFDVVPLADLVGRLRAGSAVPDGAVCLTFDDAYANVVRCALPVLRGLGLPACLFVPSGLLGTRQMGWWDVLARSVRALPGPLELPLGAETIALDPSSLGPLTERLRASPGAVLEEFVECLRLRLGPEVDPGESRIASAEELAEWLDAGLSVGSHAVTHPILSRLPPEHVRQELAESKQQLEGLTGSAVSLLAYPDGRPDSVGGAVRAAAEEAGYVAALTTVGGQVSAGADPFDLPRYDGDTSLARLEARALGIEARLRPSCSLSPRRRSPDRH